MLEHLLERGEELGRRRPVHHTVVGVDADKGSRPGHDLPVSRHGALARRAHREDGGFGMVDDGAEMIDAVGAQVRDREGAAFERIQPQGAAAGRLGQRSRLSRDGVDGFLVGAPDDGHHQPLLYGDGHTDVHVLHLFQGVFCETDVHGRTAAHGAGGVEEDEIVDGYLDAEVVFPRLAAGLAHGEEVREVHLGLHGDARHLRPAREHALGDDFPHPGQWRGARHSRRAVHSGKRCSGKACRRCRSYVGLNDSPAGARAFEYVR